jgi:hypothetical protein
VGAFCMVTGDISRCEPVVDSMSGGGVRSPIVLGFIRDRRASVEVLNMNVRDLRVRLEDRRRGSIGWIKANKRFNAQLFV